VTHRHPTKLMIKIMALLGYKRYVVTTPYHELSFFQQREK